jgi:hypothetical protein
VQLVLAQQVQTQ